MAVLGRWLHCPPALPASGSTELHPAATGTHPRETAAATRLKQVLTLLLHPPRACPQPSQKGRGSRPLNPSSTSKPRGCSHHAAAPHRSGSGAVGCWWRHKHGLPVMAAGKQLALPPQGPDSVPPRCHVDPAGIWGQGKTPPRAGWGFCVELHQEL